MTVARLDAAIARRDFSDVLDAARAGAETVIERHGKPTAVVLPWADYEALVEELDDVRAGRRAAEAYEAWKNDRSLGLDWEEVKAEWERGGPADG